MDKYHQALDLYTNEQLSYAEIARRLEVKQAAVWQWIDRAGLRRPKYDPALKDRALEAYMGGASYEEAGAIVGVSREVIRAWAKERNISGQGGRNARTKPNKELAIQMYKEGKRFFEISNTLKVHAMTVSKWIKEAGIQDSGGNSVRNATDKKTAIDSYQQGMTIEQISNALGRGVETVSKWLHEENITIKSGLDRMTPEQIKEYSAKGIRVRQENYRPPELRPCAWCGKPFSLPEGRRKSRQRYCSKECSGMGRRDPNARITAICDTCGNEFSRFRSARGAMKFCGKTCQDRSVRGIQSRFQDNVFDSYLELAIFGSMKIIREPIERFDRKYGVNWKDNLWYAPDLWLPRLSVAIEAKGEFNQKEEDTAKWSAYRDICGKLVILYSKDLEQSPHDLLTYIKDQVEITVQ